MASNTVLTNVENGIATITLNRPEALNAYTYEMHDALLATLDDVDQDDVVRAIVLTGAGRGFCAGMDLSAGKETFNRAEKSSIDEHRDGGGVLVQRIFKLKKPIIAAINGPATGIGITMTLACDVRIASDKAKMGFVFAQRGIAPDACSSWFAPRIVGLQQALAWFLSGRVFPASEALSGGLVSELHGPEQLLPRAYEIATELTANTSAVSAAIVRRLLWQMQGAYNPEDAFLIESKALYYMGSSADSKEGVESFLEKRNAEFPMKISSDFPNFLK
ncbi:MAG: enoyl-CoA hydratase-related protein [Gammaproteobacteria bacterium]